MWHNDSPRTDEISTLMNKVNEPLWTKHAKQRMWDIVSGYILDLLKENCILPGYNIWLHTLDPTDDRDLSLCCHQIRKDLWDGRYSLAVANYKSTVRYFDIHVYGLGVVEMHEDLRGVFMKWWVCFKLITMTMMIAKMDTVIEKMNVNLYIRNIIFRKT